jgi:hypothetical protein
MPDSHIHASIMSTSLALIGPLEIVYHFRVYSDFQVGYVFSFELLHSPYTLFLVNQGLCGA